jgi:hypothetical protein
MNFNIQLVIIIIIIIIVFCSSTYFCVFLYTGANFVIGLCAVKFACK